MALSTGADAQTRQQREEARKQQQEQVRKQREEERAQRDAFLAEMARIERERGLAETAGTDHIAFAGDDAALSKEAELVLVRTIHWLRQHPGSVLQLQERCSGEPTGERLALSRRRTERVSSFLVDYSASAERVQRLAPLIGAHGTPCAVFLTATPAR